MAWLDANEDDPRVDARTLVLEGVLSELAAAEKAPELSLLAIAILGRAELLGLPAVRFGGLFVEGNGWQTFVRRATLAGFQEAQAALDAVARDRRRASA